MRAIDADRLVEVFKELPGKNYTAVYVKTIVEIIKAQPTLPLIDMNKETADAQSSDNNI